MPESAAAAVKDILPAETTRKQRWQQQTAGSMIPPPSVPQPHHLPLPLLFGCMTDSITSVTSYTTLCSSLFVFRRLLNKLDVDFFNCTSLRTKMLTWRLKVQNWQLHNERSSGGGARGQQGPGWSGGPSAGLSYHVCVILGREGRQLHVWGGGRGGRRKVGLGGQQTPSVDQTAWYERVLEHRLDSTMTILYWFMNKQMHKGRGQQPLWTWELHNRYSVIQRATTSLHSPDIMCYLSSLWYIIMIYTQLK